MVHSLKWLRSKLIVPPISVCLDLYQSRLKKNTQMLGGLWLAKLETLSDLPDGKGTAC
ncbi:hypothetical protein D3C81_1219010 [compost metagenome]